jgi:CTP:molybdopterin cytidylyltransferase MocA/ribosomal protein S18 acetylase RimI-like enzyme
MGSPKQTLQYRGESLLRRAALAALGAGCYPVIVVTGAYAEVSRREFEGLAVLEVLNPLWETGMASSVRAGVEGLIRAEGDATAAVLLLCDQPHVTSDVISGLVAAHRATGSPVVASTYGGSFGVPALFSRALFAELARLEGEAGAKQVIKRHASETHFLPFPCGEVDVDTPDDFSRLIEAGAIVRRATPADLPIIGRLGALLVREHHDFDPQRFLAASHRTPTDYASFIGAQLEDSDTAILVADDNGDVLGYAYAAVEGYDYMALRGPAGVLHDVIVDPEHRGLGVGRLLLDAALEFFRSRSVPRVVLLTAERNETAQRLFARMGFRRTMIEMTCELHDTAP